MSRAHSPFAGLRAALAIGAIYVALLSGCAGPAGVQLAGTAIGVVLEATGIIKKDTGDPNKRTTDLSIKVYAGQQLNTTESARPLSLVLRIYVLRSPERLRALTYAQIANEDSEKEGLGEDLVAVREITLIPGKSYDLVVKVPGEATTIGIVGMFRAPFASRWKLAFDAKRSFGSGIIVGAHACALTASEGGLIADISPSSVQSLVGVQCNS
ncbi:MAG: type VI secretion system lipoprotein TssJ [Azonexus sp.]|uniref:type VI secretion system lipoprotein TssJ n=1 Tax=Azonexus sp. TaxID=1872668 RepID=UPI00282CAAE1|nr:type VI secretion system lipoprotein TssJ [Azonexus sp.]MDR0777369.1 type VI secretion system lipoprotein TssJ [Azonexus sp.]